uniref:Uncharacterized protein n=1 Tax=Chrysotila carterae TaxID=13221 RepID=A0A7S4BUQ7_CHRCT
MKSAKVWGAAPSAKSAGLGWICGDLGWICGSIHRLCTAGRSKTGAPLAASRWKSRLGLRFDDSLVSGSGLQPSSHEGRCALEAGQEIGYGGAGKLKWMLLLHVATPSLKPIVDSGEVALGARASHDDDDDDDERAAD